MISEFLLLQKRKVCKYVMVKIKMFKETYNKFFKIYIKYV